MSSILQRNMPQTDLYPALADASMEHPEDFAERVLHILCDFFPLRAATWYSYREGSAHLILRGQHGLDYNFYESFQLPLETLPGQSAQTGNIITSSDLSKHGRYHNIDLIARFGLTTVAAVPLIESKSDQPGSATIVRGVLCLYPKLDSDLEQIAEQIASYCPFILRLYVASLGRMRVVWRKKIVEKAGYSHDMLGLLYRLTLTLQELVKAEAVTIFRLDPKNKGLCPLGTTGLERSGERLSAKEVRSIFLFEGTQDPTYQVVKKRALRLLENATKFAAFDRKRGFEKLVSPLQNVLLVPLIEAASAATKERKVLGVARILNRTQCLGGTSHVTSFGWEEMHLVTFYAEVTALMVHFTSRGEAALNDFTRCMHGAKNNLQAAIFNLELLVANDVKVPEKLHYALSNSIAFLSDIHAQVHRVELKNEHQLPRSKIQIYKEILVKIVGMAKRSAQAQRVDSFVINVFDEYFNEPHKFPTVWANKDALLCVFRNLAENAVKYCNLKRKPHHLTFSYRIIPGKPGHDIFRIVVKDDGIGIAPEDIDLIFVPGYRSDLAIQRYPAGNGFGLADCRELLKAMDGRIECEIEEEWTMFTVDIPICQ